ncbi:MAG TPA: iron-containing redox enzyme family protein [Candidatus Binatia bacterium]
MGAAEAIREEEPGLPPEELIAAIWEERRNYVRAGRIKQPHPWSAAVGRGEVPKKGLVEYVKNRYYFLVNINRKDAQIIANCPFPEARRMLLRKYIDEEGQDVAGGGLGPHYDMWLKVAAALGVPREKMDSFADVLPVYRFTVDAVFDFAKSRSWIEGVAATYATEGGMWRRYTPKEEHHEEDFLREGAALKQYYGLPDEALQFYHVHSDANDEHGDINENILKKFCVTRELQRKALAAARFRWDNQETRHDIVYRYFAGGG